MKNASKPALTPGATLRRTRASGLVEKTASGSGSKHAGMRRMRVAPVAYGADVEALLVSAGLPVSDLGQAAGVDLFGVRDASRLVGVIGIEAYGSAGLLRSLAVEEAHRKCGLGRTLVEHAESWASRRGVKQLYLLTTSAAAFFSRLGYEAMPRSEAPLAVAGTTQFAGLCPASSIAMRKVLAADALPQRPARTSRRRPRSGGRNLRASRTH